MIVVSNTSPISNLAAVGQLNLLEQLYGSVIIPLAVYQELLDSGPTDPATVAVQSLDWILVQSTGNLALLETLKNTLDPGEAEEIGRAHV